jgi:catalase (peroxidase I)
MTLAQLQKDMDEAAKEYNRVMTLRDEALEEAQARVTEHFQPEQDRVSAMYAQAWSRLRRHPDYRDQDL